MEADQKHDKSIKWFKCLTPSSRIQATVPTESFSLAHSSHGTIPARSWEPKCRDGVRVLGIARKEVPLVKMLMQLFARKGSMIPLNPWHPPHFVCRFLTPKKTYSIGIIIPGRSDDHNRIYRTTIIQYACYIYIHMKLNNKYISRHTYVHKYI